MRCERIRAVDSWRGNSSKGRHDTIFISTDSGEEGMLSMLLARVQKFLKVTTSDGKAHPCALVHWWSVDTLDEVTGMWTATPDFDEHRKLSLDIVHLDCVVRAAHLLPVFGDIQLEHNFSYFDTLDAFEMYYINKFADHHAFSIAY
jgi:hypothetical protein